jgi:CII-binding regulator of phage lambda lysogenization HflD
MCVSEGGVYGEDGNCIQTDTCNPEGNHNISVQLERRTLSSVCVEQRLTSGKSNTTCKVTSQLTTSLAQKNAKAGCLAGMPKMLTRVIESLGPDSMIFGHRYMAQGLMALVSLGRPVARQVWRSKKAQVTKMEQKVKQVGQKVKQVGQKVKQVGQKVKQVGQKVKQVGHKVEQEWQQGQGAHGSKSFSMSAFLVTRTTPGSASVGSA